MGELTLAADDVLVVMAKYPTAGAVKTRLAHDIGAESAVAVYRAFLLDLAARLAGGPWQLVWAVEPPGADLAAIVGADALCVDQSGDALGERMWRCFGALFAAGARRVVMIGVDTPHLSRATCAEAFASLHEADVVLAPVRDGGYCLVGLGAAHDVFSAVPMGTADVFSGTIERIRAAGLTERTLALSFDVDTLADLADLERLIRSGAVQLPHTRQAIDDLESQKRL